MKFEAHTPEFDKRRPVFGRAEQTAPPPIIGPTTKAAVRIARNAKTAGELLPSIPTVGEAHHVVMLGFYDLCQVIGATLDRLPTCRHLRIATLCFSKRNAADILAWLERRKGTAFRFTLLVSTFYEDHNKDLFESFRQDLAAFPTAAIGTARNHCKLTLFDLAPDECLVLEGSANLRTNRNREQLTAIRSSPLHDFHAEWIDELVGKSNAKRVNK
jgi:hypothetical protein